MSDFGRLRPRDPQAPPAPAAPRAGSRADHDGKGSLFSAQEPPPPPTVSLGALSVTCSGCGVTTPVTPRQALLAALPSLHLPVLRREFPSWMRCPACRRRRWVRLAWRRH